MLPFTGARFYLIFTTTTAHEPWFELVSPNLLNHNYQRNFLHHVLLYTQLEIAPSSEVAHFVHQRRCASRKLLHQQTVRLHSPSMGNQWEEKTPKNIIGYLWKFHLCASTMKKNVVQSPNFDFAFKNNVKLIISALFIPSIKVKEKQVNLWHLNIFSQFGSPDAPS